MDIQFVKGKPIFTSINKVPTQYPYLTEDIEAEVLIIGGGVTGAICSYYFAKNNIDTVVLEKGRIAHCSTSVTTSLLQYELDSRLVELSGSTTLENAIRSYELGVIALDEIAKFIDEYGNKCDYIKRDTLFYTSKTIEEKEIKEEYDLRKENNFKVEFIDEKNNPFSFDVKAGIIGKDGGAEIDPFKYTHHLLEIVTNLGGRVYENSEAVKVEYFDDYVEVETIYGHKVKAKKIIVATGYNTRLFTARNFAQKSTTYNIATKPVNSIEGWKDKVLIRDNEQVYNYLRTTHDNRLIIGGEDVNFIPEINNDKISEEKYRILEQRLKTMFPEINDIQVEYKYRGCFASTPDNLGFVGSDPVKSNLWYCLGYGANGILFAILGGIMLSKLYKGEKCEDMDLFKVDRFDK